MIARSTVSVSRALLAVPVLLTVSSDPLYAETARPSSPAFNAPAPAPTPAPLRRAPSCEPAGAMDANTLLQRAATVMGVADAGARLRVSPVTDVTAMSEQSDRTYPPYLFNTREQRVVVAIQAGRVRLDLTANGTGPALVNDGERVAAVTPRGGQLVPRRSTNLPDERALDPWLVLVDWQRATDVRVAQRCVYRDLPRLVLTRRTEAGAERLFVDPGTGYPVKLERREPHYLWGDVLVEYSWSIWTPVAGSRALAPMYAFRMVDGEVLLQRRHGSYRLWPADSAGLTQIPTNVMPLVDRPLTVDTVRVNADTYLLRSASYTNVVTLQRDTVFVLDAPVDADRAQRDSAWIARLFPGRHPVVVVVTDLAWPHIAGVRQWVAMGATIVSRAPHRAFLERVVQRRWALSPDALERRAGTRRLPFRAVADRMALAGGAVQLWPIDGAGSEGALMAYLPGAQFLWAGDFVQPGGADSFSRVYADEVAAAVTRAGIAPVKVAAMHFPLSDWAARPK